MATPKSALFRRSAAGQQRWRHVRILNVVWLLLALAGIWLSRPGTAAAEERQKLVFAHYMVCCPRVGANPTVDDFLAEISEAAAAGIDGFALNCGAWKNETLYKANSALLFEAARRFGPGFHLFFSADQIGPDEAADMVMRYGHHPNQLRYQGRPVLSSFMGDPAWAQAVRVAARERAENVFIIPYFFPASRREVPTLDDVRSLVASSDDIDGFFYFGAAGASNDLSKAIRINANEWSKRGKLFMAGITAYYRGLRNNYRIFESKGYDGVVQQWMAAIESQTSWVELISWNDWGESTYLAPLKSPDVNERWTNEWGHLLSHRGFLEANRYFIDWFKTGRQPAIEAERVYYAYRLHDKYAQGRPVPSEPKTARPAGAGTLTDRAHFLAFMQRPAELTVRFSEITERVAFPAGMTLASVPMHAGKVAFEVARNGVTIASKTGEFPISERDGWSNFNVLAGALALDNNRSAPEPGTRLRQPK